MSTAHQLNVRMQAVRRLVKEDDSYRKELTEQRERVQKLEAQIKNGAGAADENAEFMIKQEKRAAQETKAVFIPLHLRVREALEKLEEQIAIAESEGEPADDIAKAKEVLALGHDMPIPPV